jgi:chromate transporter
MSSEIAGLFWHFLLLGSVAVGGLSTVMPDMYRYVVDERGLISGREFADVYAIAQAAPGPNALWVALVGLQATGLFGALAALVAMLLPATTFTCLAISLHARRPDAPLALAVRRGLAPVAVGFMLASGWVLVRSADHGWTAYAVTAATVFAVLRTRLNPMILIAAGALAGIAGLV